MIPEDRRAVSTAVSHAMSIGITAILVTGLLMGSSQLLTDQRERVTERGLEDVGSAITSELVRLDQFNTTGTEAAITSNHPERIGGRQYDVQLLDKSGDDATLYLNSTGDGMNIRIPYRMTLDTDVCESHVDSGTITVAYDRSVDCIELRNS